jgi:hypothetical protein
MRRILKCPGFKVEFPFRPDSLPIDAEKSKLITHQGFQRVEEIAIDIVL